MTLMKSFEKTIKEFEYYLLKGDEMTDKKNEKQLNRERLPLHTTAFILNERVDELEDDAILLAERVEVLEGELNDFAVDMEDVKRDLKIANDTIDSVMDAITEYTKAQIEAAK